MESHSHCGGAMKEPVRRSFRSLAGSIAWHGLALALLVVLTQRRPEVLSPLRLPGTPQGQHVLLTYSLGGTAEVRQSSPLPHSVQRVPSLPKLLHPSAAPTPVASSPATSEAGSGITGDSAKGDDNVRVALPQVHPRPQPDLSVLPHGTAGDVVVDVVIDDAGKVTSTTLVKGLGGPIDKTVMQALSDWVFTPATRNGLNIASEQEILIHYERG